MENTERVLGFVSHLLVDELRMQHYLLQSEKQARKMTYRYVRMYLCIITSSKSAHIHIYMYIYIVLPSFEVDNTEAIYEHCRYET